MKKLTGSRIGNLIVVAAVVIVPLLYAGLLTLAYQNPTNRLDDLTAAVVNEDSAYTATLADGSTKTFNLGKELEDTLTNPGKEEVGFTWKSMDAAQAEADMKTEAVRAILYIPADFSKKAAAVGSTDPASAATQELRLVTDDGVNYLAGTMAKTVATELSNRLENEGSEQVIDTLLLSVSTIRDGMVTASEGASQLTDAAGTLADGTKDLADGADTLNVGIKQLADGSVTLSSGLQTLATGTATAADGSTQLANGLATLASGTDSAASGAQQLASGASQVAAGTSELASKTAALPSGASQLAAGSTQLATGVSNYTAAVSKLRQGADLLYAGTTDAQKGLLSGIARLVAGVGTSTDTAESGTLYGGANALAAGTAYLDAAVNDGVEGNPSLKAGAAQLDAGLSAGKDAIAAYTGGVDAAYSVCQASSSSDPTLAQVCGILTKTAPASQAINEKVSQAAQGAAQLNAGVQKLAAQTPTLKQGAAKLQGGVQQIAGGTAQLSTAVGTANDDPTTGSTTLMAAVNGLHSGLDTLDGQSSKLTSGSNTLKDNLVSLNQQIPSLAAGISQLNTGAKSLSDGANSLSTGLGTLSGGASTAASSSQTLADGLARLTNGANTAATGSQTLASNLGTAANGSQSLADGASQVNEGANKLADGSTTLSDGIKEGADKIPAYTDSERNTMTKVGSDVATVDAIRNNAVHNNGAGFTPMFMSLSLWVGAIALFLILPALDKRDHGEHWWASAIRPATTALLLAVAQAVIMMVAVNAAGELHAKNLLGLACMAIAASVCFMAVNQACVAALAFRGRFVSIVLLSLQITSMGATFPIETTPKFFQWIHPFLPMSYTQLSFRRLIAGAGVDGIYGQTMAVLAAWTVVAVFVTLLGARLRRGRKPLPADNALAPTAA